MRLNRRRLRLTKGKLSNMSQEQQKLSFFFVIIFLGVFGVIVLAEVLFMEDKGEHITDTDFFYDENNWDTPQPLSNAAPATSIRVAETMGNHNDRFQKSLKHHQEEMERLIRNISARIQSSMGSSVATVKGSQAKVSATKETFAGYLTPPPLRPYNYIQEDGPLNLTFDFKLRGNFTGHDAIWQPVNGTMAKFYVYSAYFDGRRDQGNRRTVRIVGATKTKIPERVFCQFHVHWPDGMRSGGHWPRPRPVPAKVSVIRENWNLKFSACFVLCPVPSDLESVPTSVSVITLPAGHAIPLRKRQETTYTTSNQLPVHNHEVGTGSVAVNNTHEVGVCVKPIHFNYNLSLELVEFIELNRILGVTRFTFYNNTLSPRVDCLLRKYMSEGIVEVLPWKLPIKSQSEIRTEGLFAALNDCLYRNMNRFHYLMLIDFDEFIIPRDNHTIPDMLKFVDAQRKAGAITATGAGSGVLARVRMNAGLKVRPRFTSSYSFQNAFFYLQFADDNAAASGPGASFDNGRGLRVLRKTRRKDKFNPQKQRSKYICIPRHVSEAGNHFIWEFVTGYNVNVPTSVGYLHHYRVCEFGGNDCVKTDSTVDRSVYRYREDLVHRVEQVMNEGSCGFDSKHGGDVKQPTRDQQFLQANSSYSP